MGGIALLLFFGAGCSVVPSDNGLQEGNMDSQSQGDGITQDDQIDSETTMNNDQENTGANWEETIVKELQVAFAQKYNKPMEQIQVEIGLAKENKFVRGEVKIGNSESPLGFEGGIFYAVRDSINGNWIIVHDGNGIIPCEPLELADFPQSMMGGCVRE